MGRGKEQGALTLQSGKGIAALLKSPDWGVGGGNIAQSFVARRLA